MPVALQCHDDRHDKNLAPLQTINRSPDFIRERSTAHVKASRKAEFDGQSILWKESVNDNTDINENFMKMRSRGRHKERDEERSFHSSKNETDFDGGVHLAQRNSDEGKVDSSEVKLSVKERIKLLNTQNADPPELPRGRHRGPRGWLKKRDQSAPPSNSRNRVFQTERPSGEKVSSARRSRSIERNQKPNDEPLDHRLGEFTGKKQSQSHITFSKNFQTQAEVNQTEMFGFNSTQVKDNSYGRNASTVTSCPMGEPHFNPRSRMRDARTVKNFSKSISVKRNSPPGSHIQNVLNSLRQKENAAESTSESSLNVSERERVDERSGVSVKRMVSFIHKGGLENTSISRPSNVRRHKNSENKQNGPDSDQFSIFSSSQTDSFTPAKKPSIPCINMSTVRTLDSENSKPGTKVWQNYPLSLNPEIDEVGEEELEKLDVPKLQSEVIDSLKSGSLCFENDNEVDSGTKLSLSASDLNVEESMQVIGSEHMKSLMVTSGRQKVNQNIDSISTNISSSNTGMQVYNLNYRSDSSSSQSKNEVVETKGDGIDHEWNKIVAKSYALNSTSEIEIESTGKYTGAKTTSQSRPPLKKFSSQSTYKESDNDDVFDGSMHPLDFALAVHSISDYSVPQSPDRSHASKSTPRDGVVYARRVQVTDETDENLGIQDNARIENGLQEQLGATKSGNRNKIEPIYAKVKKEQKTFEHTGPGKIVTPLTKASSGESKSSQKKETYSTLTTVNLKADTSESVCKVTDVNSSHDVSVEVDVDSEEDYVKINPSYNPSLNAKSTDVLILKEEDCGKIKSRQEEPVMGGIPHKDTHENPPSFPSEVQKPPISATSPEVRRHRLKGKHYKMPSKSSVTSTGSVSYQHSSHSSTSNDAGSRRRTRNKKTSVLSPALFIKPKDLPPNDITVVDPHSSVDSTKTPRSRPHSRSKSRRSNSDVSSASASSLSQLNKFFDMMGLESEVLSSVLKPVSYEDESVFQEMHTWRVGSSTNSSQSGGLSEGSRVSEEGVMNMKRLTKLPDQSQSIITKNARVIKWLVQCKKSQTVIR